MSAPARLSGERAFDSGGPALLDIGESALVERLRAVAAELAPGTLLVPPGDDAAVWEMAAGRRLILSQDALVEGVDFQREWTTPRRVGRKSMAAALSDVAGMGAEPAWCLATLCASPSTRVDDVMDVQRGLCETAAAAGCAVAGGDVSAIEGPLVIDVCVGGTAPEGRLLRRDRGQPGDHLLVTGTLGAAAAGLHVLREGSPPHAVPPELIAHWIDAQTAGRLRLREGVRLAEEGVECGGDISDGVLADARRLAAASGCGAELWLDAMPLAPGLRDGFGDMWLDLAVGGGEDFELLVAAPPTLASQVRAMWPADLAPLTPVGRLTSGDGVALRTAEGGSPVEAPRVRAHHFDAGR